MFFEEKGGGSLILEKHVNVYLQNLCMYRAFLRAGATFIDRVLTENPRFREVIKVLT